MSAHLSVTTTVMSKGSRLLIVSGGWNRSTYSGCVISAPSGVSTCSTAHLVW